MRKRQKKNIRANKESVHKISVKHEKSPAKKDLKKEYLEAIMNALDVGVAAINTEGKLTFVNNKLTETTGFSKKELIGQRSPFSFWSEEGLEDINKAFEKTLKGVEASYELLLKRKDGQIFTASVSPRIRKDPFFNIATIKDISKQKEAEKMIKQSEESLRLAQRASKVGSWDWDLVNDKLTWSDEVYNQYDLKPNELTPSYEEWTKFIHPDDLEFVNRSVREAIEEDKPYSIDIRMISKKGRHFFIHAEGTIFKDETGKVVRFIGTQHDITGRKKAEHKLRLYTQAAEESSDGFQITDLDGYIRYTNKTLLNLFGYTAEEMTGMHVNEMNADTTFPEHTIIPTIKKTGRWVGEIMAKNKEGRVFPLELMTAIVKDDKGKPIALVGSMRDITERKVVENKLRLYTQAVEESADGFQITDTEGNIIYSNKATLNMFGYSAEEMTGMSVNNLNVDSTLAGREIIPQIKKTGVWSGELLVRDKVGKVFDIWLMTSVVRDKEGKPIALIGSLRDISQSKKVQEEREKLLRDLTERNKELNSLYTISKIYETPRSLDEIYRKTVEVIPPAWRYPKITCVRLTVNDKEFETKNFAETKWNQIADIYVFGKVVGQLGVYYLEEKPILDEGPFTREERYLINTIADGVGATTERKQAEYDLRNAYSAERRIAETLQKSLIPRQIPKVKGLEIKYQYQSATEEAEVGGDFYDFFEIRKNLFCIIMGDVAGRGIDAAAETARVKYLIRDRAYSGMDPDKVLSSVNDALFEQKIERFTALTHLLYDAAKNKLTISNAGNPYPCLVTRKRWVEITGAPVSVVKGATYPSEVIKLKKNDLVLLYTDGLTEARHDGELYGEERIKEFVDNNVDLSLEELLKQLVLDVRKVSHDNLIDDFVIIGLKKT